MSLDSTHFSTTTYECTYATFWSTALSTSQKCAKLAYGACEEEEELVNFFAFFWCYLDGSTWLYVLLSILFIYLIFKFISSTIEEFCAPSITFISDWLKLSEALAAVTLLAFANGAGDVITAIVASSTSNGISYNIGSLYGAGLFACALVISLIIFKSSKDIVVTPSCVYRDIGIYIFSTVFILIVSALGEITVAISVCLLLIYAALVIIVYVQDWLLAKETFKDEKGNLKAPEPEPEEVKPQALEDETYEQPHKKKRRFKDLAKKFKYHLLVMSIATKMVFLAKFKYRQEQHEKGFSERTALEKVTYVVDFPFDLIRKLTIPPCEIETFSKTLLVLWPFPGLFLLGWTLVGSFTVAWLYVIVPLGCLLMAVFFFTCPDHGLPRYIAVIEVLGLVMSVVWTYIMSSILVDLLQMWTIFTGISATYMGLTVIAVGSALPDGVTTLALSAKGYGDMAITGNYSSQCFGFLVGFGLSMLKKTITSGTQFFDLWDLETLNSNALDVLAILAMLTVLTVSFIYGVLRNFHFDRILGAILLGIYAVFLVVATYFAIAILVSGTTE